MQTSSAQWFDLPESNPVALHRNGSRLEIIWDSGAHASAPLVWLRDNCPCGECRIETTGEHRYFLGRAPQLPDAATIGIHTGTVTITWTDGHTSNISADQLRALYRVAARRQRPIQPWGEGFLPVSYDHGDVIADRTTRLSFLRRLLADGVVVISNMPNESGECSRFVAAVGAPVRETPFDRVHDVHFKRDGYNVAHSDEALPPHTDFASYQWPPSGQVLHMLKNDVSGGESLIVDGWRTLRTLRRRDPDAFETLTRVLVPFREHSSTAESWTRAPIVRIDAEGYIAGIRFSNQLMLPLPPHDADVDDFYRAYHVLSRALVDPANQVTFRLDAGQMLVLHSHRVLHGRHAYNGHAGARHLQDTYFEFDDIASEAARLGGEIP